MTTTTSKPSPLKVTAIAAARTLVLVVAMALLLSISFVIPNFAGIPYLNFLGWMFVPSAALGILLFLLQHATVDAKATAKYEAVQESEKVPA